MRLATAILAACCFVPAYGGPVGFATNGSNLVSFNTSSPSSLLSNVSVTGLQGGETLLGIDFRPANGQLYGLGSTSRLYTINPATGVATQVGSAAAFTLSGTAFGFDFNPTVDRIRVTSNTGQNLRLNPNDGTLAATDTALTFAVPGGSPNISGSAYTNNFAGAGSTTLYDIDYTTNSLYTQSPPNNGTLNLVGSLGIDITSNAGFDITADNAAYAVLQVNISLAVIGNLSNLYTIDLSTGAATLVGQVGTGDVYSGFAIQTVPEPATLGLIGLGLLGMGIWHRRRNR